MILRLFYLHLALSFPCCDRGGHTTPTVACFLWSWSNITTEPTMPTMRQKEITSVHRSVYVITGMSCASFSDVRSNSNRNICLGISGPKYLRILKWCSSMYQRIGSIALL